MVHLFSQLHKWNASVYAGLTASGMVIMPSARMLVNLRKKNAQAEERAAQVNNMENCCQESIDSFSPFINISFMHVVRKLLVFSLHSKTPNILKTRVHLLIMCP